jgi:PTS system mannitol-specific IIC component
VLCGIATGFVVTFLVAIPMVKRFNPTEPGAEQFRFATEPETHAPQAQQLALDQLPTKILFVCEAGMGSSVVGSAVLRRKLEQAGLNVAVEHCALTELPPDAQLAICQRSLAERVQQIAPRARVYPVDDYINAPAYDEVLRIFTAAARK